MKVFTTLYKDMSIKSQTNRFGCLTYYVIYDNAPRYTPTQYHTFSEAYHELKERERYAKMGQN